LVGREVTYEAPEELGRAAIRYFALATADDNPLYRDEEFARAHGRSSIVAPPTLVCETNQYMSGPMDSHGYIGHLWRLPLDGWSVIRGGNEYEFYAEVSPDDRLRVTWRLADISERTSSKGNRMAIVTSEITYRNQSGAVLAVNRDTTIYIAP
jgi:acyl dehydratase